MMNWLMSPAAVRASGILLCVGFWIMVLGWVFGGE